jgi:RNA polymerase sigma factor (sigma-70 family)
MLRIWKFLLFPENKSGLSRISLVEEGVHVDGGASRQLDPQQLAAWHAAHADRLKAFLIGLLRDASLADEALQSTFTKALTHGGEVQPGSEKAWLFQVACNEAMAIRRSRKVQDKVLRRISTASSASGEPDDVSSRGETSERVRRALASLPEEQRSVVIQRIYENKTFQEIADSTQVPLGTVLTRMRLALLKLRQALDSER